MSLVLSQFPGVDLLGMAFERSGYTVVRGPDPIYGGDIKTFTTPPGVFQGIIGGPPCQSHCTYANLNRAQGKNVREDLVHEFIRSVEEGQPHWWLMENSPQVPTIEIPGYFCAKPIKLNARWFGSEQSRLRKWQFGCKEDRKLYVDTVALEPARTETACMASEGRSGKLKTVQVDGKPRTRHSPRRSPAKFCELQGLPPDFMDKLPFTNEWKYRVVGNGVPLQMGMALAAAVKETTEFTKAEQADRLAHRDLAASGGIADAP